MGRLQRRCRTSPALYLYVRSCAHCKQMTSPACKTHQQRSKAKPVALGNSDQNGDPALARLVLCSMAPDVARERGIEIGLRQVGAQKFGEFDEEVLYDHEAIHLRQPVFSLLAC
ncbi:hypothetical protein [Devosia psychrophila]|uniref:hypothetical protein n=1 Tax=Devosia psychrophila TaxID=728005 RepID=UPI00116089F7|nr:hypothetical protein [Devosia psychrophila]